MLPNDEALGGPGAHEAAAVSELIGAWSLSRAPIRRLLDVRDARAMLAALGADAADLRLPAPVGTAPVGTAPTGTAPVGTAPVATGRLWLRAAPGKRRSAGSVEVAMEGFVAGELVRALEPDFVPEGHYVLARHDARSGTLSLARSPSGGERLYVARLGDLVLFASSVRPLLAHPRIGRRLERGVLDEVLLSGLVLFGARTLHAGIEEVLPGHVLELSDRVGPQRGRRPQTFRSVAGAPQQIAKRGREALTEAVVAAAGSARPVPVALSGGIDSSAVAAAAVDAFGADGVQAITYRFDDPTHASELHHAEAVVQHLGIRRHHVFSIRRDTYLQDIPETVWRNESLVHWPKAFMLQVAREVRALGHDRYLTGFGVGSHTAYLGELARGLRLGPRPSPLTAHWRAYRFGARRWPERVGKVHPALEPPHPRLYYFLLRWLRHDGYVRDVASFFPRELSPLLERAPDLAALEPELCRRPLGERLTLGAIAHLVSCIDVTRSEKASRELGVFRVSPAHFDRCIPYTYFPLDPRPRLWSEARALRPGKHLLRLGFAGSLPDSVLYRVKSWGDAVASDAWLREGRRAMLAVLPAFPSDLGRHGPRYPAAVQRWEPRSILATSLAFRFWERMFVDLPVQGRPPSWQSLWSAARRRDGAGDRRAPLSGSRSAVSV